MADGYPFEAGGEVGDALAAIDWAATPLGPPEQWPHALRTTVATVLRSRFSMWMGWGPELLFFCNDAYRRDTLGAKFPWALGRPIREVWAEIYADIGPRIERVVAGEATWDEDLLLFLQRNGFPEETYHTFSYSPVTGDDGLVAGLLCVVTESTERVITSRRLATLRALGADPTTVSSAAEVVSATLRTLQGNDLDLPFAAIYLYGDDGSAHLAGTTGIGAGIELVPGYVPPGGTLAGSPLPRSAAASRIATLPPGLPTGGWPEPPSEVMLVPIPQPGAAEPTGMLLTAVNRYRPLDEGYRQFLGLVAGQLGAALASARTYEAERRRAEQLAELDRAKTAFFTNVSHELRTPLTLLIGPTEDALADTTDPLVGAQRTRAEVVLRNGQRLLKLVNTLLDLSRLEAGRLEPRPARVDLGELTAQLVSGFTAAAERAGIDLRVERLPAPEVWVDTEMWAKVVSNLLSNALKFTFDGGITVRVGPLGTQGVRVQVADTGIGIDPAEQPRLFERFYRATASRARTHEGSGIGLALVAELVALHGGTVGVASTPGAGTTFTVDLPGGVAATAAPVDDEGRNRVLAGHLAEIDRWEGGADATPVPAAPGQPRQRVLVVDDNADMRDYVAGLLADSHEVLTAADGAAGLAAARRSRPDLVLSDVMMPVLDGFGLLAALRADPATASIPVVLLSARAGEEATVEGLEAGADDYLVKPFAARELRARVRANLELAARRAEAADAAVAAAHEVAEREHHIADELQRSLLPQPSVVPDGLAVASFYRAGVEGTQVGGDWFDVVELGAGRVGLVIGDVMGRGVRAAAVMGQLRAAVRAYARLDLPAHDVLELLDATVREIGDDHIVTCVFATWDPADRALAVASAGHPPPLVVGPDGSITTIEGSGPPLGTGAHVAPATSVVLDPGATLLLYTDGLVERRGVDVGAAIERLGHALVGALDGRPLADVPADVVATMLPEGPDDDVALLLAKVDERPPGATARIELATEASAAARARRFVSSALGDWGMPDLLDAAQLAVSELVTNAVVHGRPPVTLRLRSTASGTVMVEVADGAAVLPRLVRADDDDEHGRGLAIVSVVADRWGTRTTPTGKVVWCRLARRPL